MRGIRASQKRRPDGGNFFRMPRDFLPLKLQRARRALTVRRAGRLRRATE